MSFNLLFALGWTSDAAGMMSSGDYSVRPYVYRPQMMKGPPELEPPPFPGGPELPNLQIASHD